MKQKFNQKISNGDNKVHKYGISHLSAGEAKVKSVSAFTVGDYTIEPKTIEEKNNAQIDATGYEAEVTDYAILMGVQYWESYDKNKGVRRLGNYWTSTPVTSKTPLNTLEGPKRVTAYKLEEVKTDYTFYGYSKGMVLDEIQEPCIVEIENEKGITLCINKNGEMWTLKEKNSYYAEATIGTCMGGPRINETINSLVTDKYLGSSYDVLSKLQRRLEERDFWIKIASKKYQYVGGTDKFNIRETSDTSVGIRPIFNTYNHAGINNVAINGVKKVNTVDFPQTVASKKEQKELDKLLKKNELTETGRYFPTSNEGMTAEYEYNGEKYVRVTANFYNENSKTSLSNGCEYKNGNTVWVRVEAVKQIVTEDNFSSLTEKILFAGVPYQRTLSTNYITHKRSSDFIVSLLSNADDFFFTVFSSPEDRIISGTEWMQKYNDIKNKYTLYYNIPFEETELEAAKRYKKEYQKLIEECKRQRISMKFDSYDQNAPFKKIDYSYRPSVEFLNSIEDPIIATLAALGPRSIWNDEFYKEYLKAYGLWALLTLQKENIIKISDQMYSDELEKALELKRK